MRITRIDIQSAKGQATLTLDAHVGRPRESSLLLKRRPRSGPINGDPGRPRPPMLCPSACAAQHQTRQGKQRDRRRLRDYRQTPGRELHVRR